MAAVLLGVVLLGANYKLTFGLAAPKWDADMFFAPFQMLVADHARAGKFLLWDPWVNGGSPDYAEPQIGAFSPLAIGVGLVTGGTELAFQAYWLIIWFLGGLGVFWLGRHLDAPPWGCYVVALGFMFSGFYTGHAEHTSTLYTISSLGFVIWRLDVALSSRTLRPAVEAGVIWGLSALGGYPGWVFLNACFAALWAAGRAWFPAPVAAGGSDELARPQSTGSRPTIGFALLALTTMVAVGIPVMSPTIAAFFLEAPGYTDRSRPLTRELAVTYNALHPGALATFASPYLSTLKRLNPDLWAYTDLSTVSVYLGPIVPVLAILALVSRPRNRWRWWIVTIVVGFLLAALGQSIPIRTWLYDLVPPTRYFRHAGILRIYGMFGIVVLALLGTRELTPVNREPLPPLFTRFAVTAGCVAALAIGAYYAVAFLVRDVGQHAGGAQFHLWLVWSGVFAIALVVTRTDARTRTRLVTVLLLTLATADAFVTAHLAQLTMYDEDARIRAIWTRVAREHDPSLDLAPRGLQRDELAPAWLTAEGTPNDKNLPLKIPALKTYVALTNHFQADLVKHPVLSAMAVGPNRIWFTPRTVAVSPSDAAYDAFVARSESLHQGVLVVHPPDLMTKESDGSEDPGVASISELPPAAPIGVSLTAYRPDELRFQVICPEKGWLLVTDRWARRWQATVNGQHADVWGANFIFRAVAVNAGTNDVRFTYHPVGFPYLVILSWSIVLLTLAHGLYARVRNRQGHARETFLTDQAGVTGERVLPARAP